MATHKFDEHILFVLPSGYEFEHNTDDENDYYNIKSGRYLNDDGDVAYKCSVRITSLDVTHDPDSKIFTAEEMLNELYGTIENASYAKAKGAYPVMFAAIPTPISVFGSTINMQALTLYIVYDRYKSYILTNMFALSDDTDEAAENYQQFLDIANTVRVDGKALNITGVNAYSLLKDLNLDFNNAESLTIDAKISLNVVGGSEMHTSELGADGEWAKTTQTLKEAYPDESLYPHYNNLRNVGGGFFGATVIVNSTGTEYSFQPLKNMADDEEIPDEYRAVYKRIVEKDTGIYNLDKKARELQKLFHVNDDAFDMCHDRENEIEQRLLHRAYMMSALRSFAWTVASYCKENDTTPEDMNPAIASWAVSFVAGRDWLNYDESSYCKGLCGCQDLHVFYLPAGVSSEDKKKLLSKQEDYDRVKTMKAKFPAYNEILSQVASLSDLRKDLEFIYPAVKMLWDQLAEARDFSEALTGDAADIVYAWCSLALAAKEPFFVEDGPTTCYFNQIKGDYSVVSSLSTYKENKEPLPQGVYASEDGYAVINDDWAVQLPKGWVYSSNPDFTMGRPFAAISKKEFEDSDRSPFAYGDRCFTVFQVSPNNFLSELSGAILNSGSGEVISRSDLTVSYNCTHDETTTYCQYVIVTTRTAQYTIQLFYKDAELGEYGRIEKIEEILKTIRLASEAPPAVHSKITASASEKATPHTAIKRWVNVPASDCEIEEYLDRLNEYNGTDEYIILPEGITEIGYGAFQSIKTLKGVIIPEGVTEIGMEAFCLCENLEFVSFPSTLKTIGIDAFKYCEALNRIDIPDEVTEIEAGAFGGCKELRHAYIPDSIFLTIDDSAFDFCDKLTIHTEKDGKIWEYAKENGIKRDSKAPTKVNIDKIPEGKKPAAAKAPAKKAVPVASPADPASDALKPTPLSKFDKEGKTITGFHGRDNHVVIPDGFTKIKDFAFSGKGTLYSVVIPEGIKKIEMYAFSPCKKLTSVKLPSSLEYLSGFYECSSLSSIDIPYGVRTIGKMAFKECKKLTSVVLPPSVNKIEDSAFSCIQLKDVYIPESVTDIHEFAFLMAPNATLHVHPGSYAEAFAEKKGYIKFDNDVDEYVAMFAGCPPLMPKSKKAVKAESKKESPQKAVSKAAAPKKGEDKFTIKNGVLTAYSGNSEVVVVPEEVSRIENNVRFHNNRMRRVVLPLGIRKLNRALSGSELLESLDVPASIISLDFLELSGCKALREVILHEGLKVLHLSAFDNCDSLKEILVPASVQKIDLMQPSTEKKHIDPLRIKVYKGSVAEQCIETLAGEHKDGYRDIEMIVLDESPSEKAYIPETIPEDQSFVIEDGVLKEYIGNQEIVTVPSGTKTIGTLAFNHCYSAKKIILPDTVTKIEFSAFSECRFLEEIILPDSIESIGGNAFWKCDSMESIALPNKVKALDIALFHCCSELKKVEFPSALKRIGTGCFSGCRKMKTIELPHGLEKIDEGAFESHGIETIVIPDSIKMITERAFQMCWDLKNVYVPYDTELVDYQTDDDSPFYCCHPFICLHVFRGSKAEEWAKKHKVNYAIELTEAEKAEKLRKEQAEARRKAEEEERKRLEEEARRKAEEERIAAERKRREELEAKKKALWDERRLQEQIVAENKGIFGEKARRRKAAQARIAEIDVELGKM